MSLRYLVCVLACLFIVASAALVAHAVVDVSVCFYLWKYLMRSGVGGGGEGVDG